MTLHVVTDDADLQRSCARKRAYPTEREARRVAGHMADKYAEPFTAYGCTHCGEWHVGRALAGRIAVALDEAG